MDDLVSSVEGEFYACLLEPQDYIGEDVPELVEEDILHVRQKQIQIYHHLHHLESPQDFHQGAG